MITLAWVAVGIGAAVQAITGFGFSLVSAPFLLAAYPAPLGIEINLVLSVSLNVLLVSRNYRYVERGAVVGLLLPAAGATVVAGLALKHAPTQLWAIVASSLCLLGTLALWSGVTLRSVRSPAATAAVGALSGAMNVTTGIGGPPVVLYGVNARWEPVTARATLTAFFLGINAVGLATLGPPSHFPLALLATVAVGALAGMALSGSLSATNVRNFSLALSAVGSALVLIRAL